MAETLVVVFSCVHEAEAHLVRAALTREGIASTMSARPVVMIPGDGLLIPQRIRVRVPSRDAARALAVIREAHAPQGADWRCAACGEDNPANFEVCWRCQAQP